MTKINQKKIKEIALKYEGHNSFDKEVDTIKEFLKACTKYISFNEKYKNSYLFGFKGTAADKINEENDHSFEKTFSIFDKNYYLCFKLSAMYNSFRIYKNLDINELKIILKEIQTILYVMRFNKYKNYIDLIDILINTKGCNNDILFTQEYYSKQVEKFFSTKLISKDKKVKMSKVDRELLAQKRKEKQLKMVA